MRTNCVCLGKFKRIDLEQKRLGRVVMVRDKCNRVATWQCDRCGAQRTQRKRLCLTTPACPAGCHPAYRRRRS